MATENLSELLEKEITPDISREDVIKLKQQVHCRYMYNLPNTFVYVPIPRKLDAGVCSFLIFTWTIIQVQDKAYYCEKRREKLLEHVNQGYDQDWWRFTVPVEL